LAFTGVDSFFPSLCGAAIRFALEDSSFLLVSCISLSAQSLVSEDMMMYLIDNGNEVPVSQQKHNNDVEKNKGFKHTSSSTKQWIVIESKRQYSSWNT
jgi:hypothetical protein